MKLLATFFLALAIAASTSTAQVAPIPGTGCNASYSTVVYGTPDLGSSILISASRGRPAPPPVVHLILISTSLQLTPPLSFPGCSKLFGNGRHQAEG